MNAIENLMGGTRGTVSASRNMTGGTAGRAWTKGEYTQPMPLSPDRMTAIGTDRGGARQWYSSQYGELAERPHLLDENREMLPNGPILQEEPGMWRAFDVYAPGSFERLAAGIVRPPRTPKPHRPIDSLALTWLAQSAPERIFAAPARGFAIDGRPIPLDVKPAAPPARGAARIIDRLASVGATVTLSSDSEYLVVSCADGRPGPGVPELVVAAHPLLLAHLRGVPLRCVVGKHKGEAPEAESLTLGGAPVCSLCLAGQP